MLKKVSFLISFKFHCNRKLPGGGDGGLPSTTEEVSKYSDVVIVNDESEQDGYPEDVLVAWPTIYTERLIWSINLYAIYNRGADPTPYGLTYPLTVADTVENWESVYDFVMSIDESVRSYAMSPSRGYAEGEEGWYPLPDLSSRPD